MPIRHTALVCLSSMTGSKCYVTWVYCRYEYCFIGRVCWTVECGVVAPRGVHPARERGSCLVEADHGRPRLRALKCTVTISLPSVLNADTSCSCNSYSQLKEGYDMRSFMFALGLVAVGTLAAATAGGAHRGRVICDRTVQLP